MSDFAAMAFGEGNGEGVCGQVIQQISRFWRGKIIDLLDDKLDGIPDFKGAKPGAPINVTGVERRRRNRGVAVDSVRKISAHIACDAGGARSDTDKSGGARLLHGDGACFFHTRERRGGIKKQHFDVGKLCEVPD